MCLYVSCHSRAGKREAQENAPTFPDFPKALPCGFLRPWLKKSWSLAPPAVQIGEGLPDVSASEFLFQANSTQFSPYA